MLLHRFLFRGKLITHKGDIHTYTTINRERMSVVCVSIYTHSFNVVYIIY